MWTPRDRGIVSASRCQSLPYDQCLTQFSQSMPQRHSWVQVCLIPSHPITVVHLPAPVIGPIAGGWIVQTRLGWRFNFWLMFITSACSLIFGVIVMAETVGKDTTCTGGKVTDVHYTFSLLRHCSENALASLQRHLVDNSTTFPLTILDVVNL